MLTSSLPLDGRDEPEKECADIKSGATSSGGFGIGFFVTAEEAEKAREAQAAKDRRRAGEQQAAAAAHEAARADRARFAQNFIDTMRSVGAALAVEVAAARASTRARSHYPQPWCDVRSPLRSASPEPPRRLAATPNGAST